MACGLWLVKAVGCSGLGRLTYRSYTTYTSYRTYRTARTANLLIGPVPAPLQPSAFSLNPYSLNPYSKNELARSQNGPSVDRDCRFEQDPVQVAWRLHQPTHGQVVTKGDVNRPQNLLVFQNTP